MERYIGTKLIQAEPQMKDGREGYKVVYPDNYVSWSPKQVFEEAYRRCDSMNFGLALEAIKLGFKATRKGWNGRGQYIVLATNISYKNADGEIVNAHHEDITSKAIAFVGTRGIQLGWLASQSDMLADDWMLI